MKKLALLLFIIVFFLTSCIQNTDTALNDCTLYFLDEKDGGRLVAVQEKLDALTVEDSAREAFSKLKSSDNKRLVPAITPDLKLSSLSVSESVCELELSSRYTKISDTSRASVDVCLVKTLCSISGIDAVVISCDGVVINKFTEDDFLTDTPRTYYDMYTVNLYFANADFDGLQADRETISLSPDTTLEYAVISRLLDPSSSGKLQSAVPAGTKLNNVYVSEGICYIDLSKEFITNVIHDELHEGIAVYSIVNTVTELPMIDSVKLLIDGNDADGYMYYKLSRPFTNNSDMFISVR